VYVFFSYFWVQFCDVATLAINNPEADLATFGYRPAMKVEIY
jgi:hypothetical protein